MNVMVRFLDKVKVRHVFMLLIGSIFIFSFSKYNIRSKITRKYEKINEEKKINLNELYKLGECLLEEAGKRIVDIRHEMLDSDFKLKSDQSRVTQADLESHRIIMHALQYKYKNYFTIKSEEDGSLEEKDIADAKRMLEKCDTHTSTRFDSLFNAKDLVVWIDPLDATQEYSENLTDYVTVMFCVAIKGEPRVDFYFFEHVIGIIHKPFSKYTVKSFLENEPEKEFVPPTNSRVIISRSHGDWFDSYLKEHLAINATVISAGGSGYKTIQLLEDKADVYLHLSVIKKWDTCAPEAILTNKGGRIRSRTDHKIDYADTNESKAFGFIAALNNFNFYWDTFKINKSK